MKKTSVQKITGLIAALVFVLCSIMPCTVPAGAAAEDEEMFFQYLPSAVSDTNWSFDRPQSLAVDAMGNVYVADTFHHQIQKLNSNGEIIAKWGTQGGGDGEFYYVSGIAVDGEGYVYVTDMTAGYLNGGEVANCRIQKFDSNGTFISKWGSKGNGDGQFERPEGIAVDGSGFVYVSEQSGRIQKFDQHGNFVKKWGTLGTQDSAFGGAKGITVDNSGSVYVVATESNTIQKFDCEGNFVMKWGAFGNTEGKFQSASGISADHLGFVYVADSKLNCVQKFSSTGTLIKKWSKVGNQSMNIPTGIATDDFGNVYVGESKSVLKLNDKGTMLARWSGSDEQESGFYVSDLALDSQDNLYAVDRNNLRIQKFDRSGNFVTSWSTSLPGDTQGIFPEAIAIDGSDNIYVAFLSNPRITSYDSNGRFLNSWDISAHYHADIHGMAFDEDGNLYTANRWDHKILVFSKDGTFLRDWGGNDNMEPLKDTEFAKPTDLTFGPDGLVYITDKERILVYDKQGNFIKKWGSVGSGDDQFESAWAIACDKDGNVYTTDFNDNRIQMFDKEGNFLAKWGQRGSGINQFFAPAAIAIDKSGNVYVADQGNSRIMIKSKEGGPQNVIRYMSLNTSPNLGFVPGGTNRLHINIGVGSQNTNPVAYVFNTKGKWVAQIPLVSNKNGTYTCQWDGRATAGNPAGVATDKLVSSSVKGTKYTIRTCVENSGGQVWSNEQTIQFYSVSKVKWIGMTGTRITAGQKVNFAYRISHVSNVEVRILDAKGKVAAIDKSDSVFPNKNIVASWDGRATAGNELNLQEGTPVPAGRYAVQIIAGNIIYRAVRTISVY